MLDIRMLYEIIGKITDLMKPDKSLHGFCFQVGRNAEVPQIKATESGFVIWFPGGLKAKMRQEKGVIMVGYRGAVIYWDEPATDQVRAEKLLKEVLKQVPIEVEVQVLK